MTDTAQLPAIERAHMLDRAESARRRIYASLAQEMHELGADPVRIVFFQAEDGIRDHCVTGVQTCALPISIGAASYSLYLVHWPVIFFAGFIFGDAAQTFAGLVAQLALMAALAALMFVAVEQPMRSEERRVGKESKSR